MSARLEAIKAKRKTLNAAQTALTEIRSSVEAQKRRATALRSEAARVRTVILDARIDSECGGAVTATPSAADLQEAELNAEAAEGAVGRISARIPAAEEAVTDADKALKDAVAEFLREEVEVPAIEEIDAAFRRIVTAGARAIAAARICRQHDRRGSSDVERLIDALQGVGWRRLPERVQVAELIRQTVTDPIPGIDEAAHSLLDLIGGGQ